MVYLFFQLNVLVYKKLKVSIKILIVYFYSKTDSVFNVITLICIVWVLIFFFCFITFVFGIDIKLLPTTIKLSREAANAVLNPTFFLRISLKSIPLVEFM